MLYSTVSAQLLWYILYVALRYEYIPNFNIMHFYLKIEV